MDKDEALREYSSKLGRKGSRKGGKTRMKALSPEQRKELARKAARDMWSKRKRAGGSDTAGD